MDRRAFLAGAGGALLASPFAATAQQPAKVFRIGYLSSGSAALDASQVEALRAGLRDFGYVEGKNIVIEFRWADRKNDRLHDLAAELVRLKVDVFVTLGTLATLAAKRATTTIPIVMVRVGDPVAMGLVASLARPGGNITGSVILSPELMSKRLELLKEASPRIRQVAVLLNPDNPSQALQFQAMEITARSLKVELQRLDVRGASEFESAFSAMTRQRVDAVAVSVDTSQGTNARAIANLAAKQRLPSSGPSEFAEAGGLIGYGVKLHEMVPRTAYFVDRILKGAKPADLPVEQPTKFELVINMKTAKAIGLTVPPVLLARADQVIQ